MQCDGVLSAVCTVREVAGVQQLVAYVVARGATAATKLPVKVWKKALRVRLPPYMVPSIFEQLDDIPTLPSGKADRKKLPPPRPVSETAPGEDEDDDDGPALSQEELASLTPQTPLEIRLAAVWRELFAKSRILLNDDFFELGGHSLLAAKLMTTLRKEEWTSHAAMVRAKHYSLLDFIVLVIHFLEPYFADYQADVYNHPTVQSLAKFLVETAPKPAAVVRRSSSLAALARRKSSGMSSARPASGDSFLSPKGDKTPLLSAVAEADDADGGEADYHPSDDVLAVVPWKFWLTGFAQIPVILFILFTLSLQQFLPWRTYSYMYDQNYSLFEIVIAAMLSTSLLYTALMILAVVLKWVLIGRFKVGKYPLWGWFYFRWWIVTRIIDLLPTTFMRGTSMITLFYRALGAKIGKHVHISTCALLRL